MKIEARWLSQKGTRTDDNRDHAGISGRHNEFLAIVADGATNGSNNGGYARAIVEAVVDWFAGKDDAWGHELMQTKLREIHRTLRKLFPRGSASIIVFHVTDTGSLTVLHSGDCLLGTHDDRIHWQVTPRTLTNVLAEMPIDAIAKAPTSTFSPKVFVPGSSWHQTSSPKKRPVASCFLRPMASGQN